MEKSDIYDFSLQKLGQFRSPGAEQYFLRKKNMDRSIDLAVQHMQFDKRKQIWNRIRREILLKNAENGSGKLGEGRKAAPQLLPVDLF